MGTDHTEWRQLGRGPEASLMPGADPLDPRLLDDLGSSGLEGGELTGVQLGQGFSHLHHSRTTWQNV